MRGQSWFPNIILRKMLFRFIPLQILLPCTEKFYDFQIAPLLQQDRVHIMNVSPPLFYLLKYRRLEELIISVCRAKAPPLVIRNRQLDSHGRAAFADCAARKALWE